MKKNLTELVFILDKSGSMAGMEADTVGGFNAMIEKQRKLPGDVLVSTVLFSSTATVLHDRADIADIAPLDVEDFTVGGCTALLDAIGDAVHHIKNVHKYAREEDRPEHTIFIITTDGMENASRRYSSDKVKGMISERREDGWDFIFLAANIDAVETATSIGIDRDFAENYTQSKIGTEKLYRAIDYAVKQMRCNERRNTRSWKDELK